VGGEAEGFAQFVDARERALQRTAWLLTGDWALAQDLVQTALAPSWPYWGKIRRGDDPEVYVRRVMVNT
jgi:DNA-directed RNA polymerase specialized sigma24 family protein